jgi:hypothetical protein
VRKLTQSRTGGTGTCFRTSLASILNLQESDVPDFLDANEDPYVNTFLAKHGLRYEELPYDAEQPPVGEHLILGISPRGGMHAVVGVDGVVKMDPHPMDGTGRGLVKPLKYGVLTRVKGEAKDVLSGKRLNSAAELLRAKHDDIYNNPARFDQNKAASYRATHQAVVDLVRQAEALLSNAKLDDDPVYWQKKLQTAKDALKQAEQFAKSNDFGRAIAYQDCAFSIAHSVIDKMRKSGTSRGSDASPENQARLAWILNKDPKKESELREAYHKAVRRGELARSLKPGARDSATRTQDRLSTRQLDKYSMQSLLDTLGIDIKAFIDRPPQQRDVLLETAFNELERLGKLSKKGGSVVTRAKDAVADALQTYVYKLKQRGIPEPDAIRLANQLFKGVKESLGEPKKATDSRRAKDYSDRAQKFLREAREHWQMHSYGDCIDDCQDAIAAGADGEDLREAKQYLEACKRKGAVKATDSGIITNPTGYRPCVGDKVGGVTIESIGSDTATLSNGTRIALKFLVSTRRTGEWKIGNTRGYDATDSRRTRLHRALDAVMDSARGRAKDAVSLCKVCRQYIPNVRGVLSRHYLNGKVCSGSGAEAPEYE